MFVAAMAPGTEKAALLRRLRCMATVMLLLREDKFFFLFQVNVTPRKR